jgi:hypothetical protein
MTTKSRPKSVRNKAHNNVRRKKTRRQPSRKKSARKPLRAKPARPTARGKPAVSLEALGPRVNYPINNIERDIKVAMSEIKPGLQPAQIDRNDTLQKWYFSKIDGRGLAPVLMRDYAVRKRLRLDPRLYNYETEDVTKTVRQIAAVIYRYHRFNRFVT